MNGLFDKVISEGINKNQDTISQKSLTSSSLTQNLALSSQQSSSAARHQKRINRVVMHLQHDYDVFALNMQGLNGRQVEFKDKMIRRTLVDPKKILSMHPTMYKNCYCGHNYKSNLSRLRSGEPAPA